MGLAPRRDRSFFWTAFLAALLFLGIGAFRTHQVVKKTKGRRSLHPPMETISEIQLVEDATFAGVRRIQGRLMSTYDRSKPRGKRLCPT